MFGDIVLMSLFGRETDQKPKTISEKKGQSQIPQMACGNKKNHPKNIHPKELPENHQATFENQHQYIELRKTTV